MPANRSLKIYHHHDGYAHLYWTNKLNFTAQELQKALIIDRSAVSPLRAANHVTLNGNFTVQRPVIEYKFDGSKLSVSSVFPQWKIADVSDEKVYAPERKSGL